MKIKASRLIEIIQEEIARKKSKKSSRKPNKIRCPNCGAINPASREGGSCRVCGYAPLPSPNAVAEAKKVSKRDDGTMTRDYEGKRYSASAGSVASLEKHGMSVEKAVKAGDFDWSKAPYAAAQAAHIVATGKPSVPKGSKLKKK